MDADPSFLSDIVPVLRSLVGEEDKFPFVSAAFFVSLIPLVMSALASSLFSVRLVYSCNEFSDLVYALCSFSDLGLDASG